jgi:hypothetical protein
VEAIWVPRNSARADPVTGRLYSRSMAFGQPAGPPASVRQVRVLLELLQAAGHTDFRDARGPMGFTQRQAAGKFTGPEAEAFIALLQGSAADPPATDLAHVSTEDLAAELQRRGWVVMEP